MKKKLITMTALCVITATAHGQIQASFFGLGTVASSDLPKVTYGVMSHPPLAWTAIEGRGRGLYDFTSTDQFVNGAPKDGNGVAQVDLVMGWTPGWAVTSQKSCTTQGNSLVVCTAPPDSLQDWTDFITQVADHYNGVNAPQVKYYEVWNEANTTSFWTGSVAQLVAMAKIAYPILKQNKYSSVLTPSVTWYPGGTTWMAKYLAGGGSALADGVSFHGYPEKTGKGIKLPVPLPESPISTNAAIQTMVGDYRVVANSNGMSGKPLITTEGGWGVNGVSDPDMQAAWITHYEILQAGLATTDNLAMQTWYTWGHASSGTIETTTGEPTPAGLAYELVMTRWLVGNIPSPCTSSGNIYSCPLGTDLIVWDTSQTCSNGVCSTAPYTPPKGYLDYEDVTGAKHPIVGTIELGVKPIWMEK
jgi:hypothetical protein